MAKNLANALAILECLGSQYKTTDKIATTIGRSTSTALAGLKELEKRGIVRRSSSYHGNQLPWVATPAAKSAIFLLKEKGAIDSSWRGKMYKDQQRKLFGKRLHLHVDIDGCNMLAFSEPMHSKAKRALFLDLKAL